ncbi:MAG: diguanylate cyclase [Candidatus Marinimicrobia bacterium]|nr:diguanylate cyclase [Candidatus Neomarinimicrobiota bacterium]
MAEISENRLIWILNDQKDLIAFLRDDLSTETIKIKSFSPDHLRDIKKEMLHFPPDLMIICHHKLTDILPLANREKIPLIMLVPEHESSVLEAYNHFPVVKILEMSQPYQSIRPVVSEFFNDLRNHAKSKILFILPDETERKLFRNISRIYKYGATFAETYAGAEELLKTKPFDLVVVNADCQDEDSALLLSNIRSKDANLPVLALSAGNRRVMFHKLYDMGVNDFLHIPFDIDELTLKISGLLRTVLSMKAIKKLSEVDYLTQLLNRRSFYDQIMPYINLSRRQNLPFSIIMTDIDHFKRINDTFGHDTGDKILIESAKIMRNNLRNYDILARFGGEEFVIFISNVNEINAMYVAEKLRKGFKEGLNDCLDKPVTMSLGVSTWSGGEVDIDKLIQQADKALYVSKNSGRNRVTHFRNLL